MGLASYLALIRLERDGIDATPLLNRVRLSPAAVKERKRVSLASQIALLGELSRLTNDPWIGVTLASDFDLRLIGMLYYVAASSITFGEALKRLERYSSLVSEVLTLKLDRARVCFSYTGQGRHADRHQSEFLATVLLRLCGHLVGRTSIATGARFAHHRSGDLRPVRTALGCHVDFDAKRDELDFDEALLPVPLSATDPYLSQLLTGICDEAIAGRRVTSKPLRSTIEDAIAPLLPHAEATAAIVAQRLGMSERTFARRLSEERLTFGEILDDLRRELTLRYLQDNLQASQIAWLLGFHHPSSFSHACRRWTGQSPSELRRNARLQPA